MDDKRNLIIALALSFVIIIGWNILYDIPRQQRLLKQQATEEAATPREATPAPTAEPVDVPAPSGAPAAVEVERSPEDVLKKTVRVAIESPRLDGSISLRGGSIDDLKLTGYHETVDPQSPEITLLSPVGTTKAYYARFGWWVAPNADIAVPDADTEWKADVDTLTPDQPVTLTWDNGAGLVFTRRIALDENYMFTVTQRVTNTGTESVDLNPYGLISRSGTPKTLGYYILHEGMLGVFNGVLEEIKYKDEDIIYDSARKKGGKRLNSTGGWLGITDKYWLVALVPDQSAAFDGRFRHLVSNGVDKYQVDFARGLQTVPAGGGIEVSNRLFAGAKVVKLVNHYAEDGGIERFDLAIDWGWYPFLTKPIFFTIDYFNGVLGNFGLAILLLTVIIKGLFFPLANKSYKSMSKMKKLQPKMMELRERYQDDKARLQKELMALYKAEKANPMSGCLPIVVQIPVFFSLYKVLFVTIEMRHAPFFGWIRDLSAPDPTSVFNLFGLLPFDPPGFLAIGIWPLVMGLTMFLQQRLNPQPPDPTQAKIMMMLPVVFTFLFARFPAGLVIYWAWNNVLSITQQWVIMRRMGVHT
ncbi:MAG: membrane protein insertase YidC [Alphaproteobacteria bacterium]